MNFRRWILTLFGVTLFLTVTVWDGFAQSGIVKKELPGFGEVEYFEGEVIVRFRDQSPRAEIERVKREMSIRRDHEYEFLAMQFIESEYSVEELIRFFGDHPDVEYIQPNFVYRLIEPVERINQQSTEGLIPNDSLFASQWGLNNEGQTYARENGNLFSGTAGADISATNAWSLTTGSENVIIAVFDTGIDYNHPDLAGNLYIDSEARHGIDTSPGSLTPDDPMDKDGHGSHVAGIIGAMGNNLTGVSGVNWNVSLMAVRVFNDDNVTSTHSIQQGFEYAIANGASISNHSYGSVVTNAENIDLDQRRVFESAAENGHLVITAAGNQNLNNDDFPKMFPASYTLDNIISVAATDSNDELTVFSNFGKNSVHIAAPGNRILSTYSDNGYSFLSGTSMAAPFVTGVAGLIKSMYPGANYQEIRERILFHADRLDNLQYQIIDGRRLNALHSLIEDDGMPPIAVSDLSISRSGQRFLIAEWTAVGKNGGEGNVKQYDLRISNMPIDENNFDQAQPVGDEIIPVHAGEKQLIRLDGLEPQTTYYLAVKSEDFFGNRSAISNSVESTLQAAPHAVLHQQNINTGLNSGDSLEGSIQISNNGEGPLQLEAAGRFRPITLFDSETRQFPYFYNTNVTELAPGFNWVENEDNRQVIAFDNTTSGIQAVELPFSFPYYGILKDSLYLSVNGFVTFDKVENMDATNRNRPLPGIHAPNDMIAVYWSNLAMTSNSEITAYHDDEHDRFILEWNRMTRNPALIYGDLELRFQLILYKGGAMTMQYKNLNRSIVNITAGLNDSSGRNGVQYSFNDGKLENELAITFIPGQPDWFEVNDFNTVIEPGNTETVPFKINASGLPAGNYYTELFLLDNDIETINRIPVELQVEGRVSEAQFYNASVDPRLQRLDLFVNGQLLKHDLQFNEATEKITVPAGINLDVEIYSEDSNSVEAPVLSQNIHFSEDQPVFVIAAGVSDTGAGISPMAASPDFRLYVGEINEEDVDENKVRIHFFNAIADVDYAGAVGFYPDQRPPVVIAEDIPFGFVSSGKTVSKGNFEVDAVSGPDLLRSFQLDLSESGGETIVGVFTGFSNPAVSDNGLQLIYTNFSGENRQADTGSAQEGQARHMPGQFEVEQNFPNPFNPVTQIQFSIPDQRDVRLDIYDLLGRRVQTLLNETRQAGIHRIEFDGSSLSSGVYFYRVQAGGEVHSRKMMLVK